MYYRQRHSAHGGARAARYRFEAVLSPSSRGRFIVERMGDHWRLWIERDLTLTYGDMILFYDDGVIEQVNLQPGCGEERLRLKERDTNV
jgi:hypothetical protein